MNRRNFVVIASAWLLARKSAEAGIVTAKSEEASKGFVNKVKGLFVKDQTYDFSLPKNPVPIETTIELKVEVKRGKKLPKLTCPNGYLVAGEMDPIIIKEEGHYHIQFLGESVGWVVI